MLALRSTFVYGTSHVLLITTGELNLRIESHES
jgi:hypothetical protein